MAVGSLVPPLVVSDDPLKAPDQILTLNLGIFSVSVLSLILSVFVFRSRSRAGIDGLSDTAPIGTDQDVGKGADDVDSRSSGSSNASNELDDSARQSMQSTSIKLAAKDRQLASSRGGGKLPILSSVGATFQRMASEVQRASTSIWFWLCITIIGLSVPVYWNINVFLSSAMNDQNYSQIECKCVESC